MTDEIDKPPKRPRSLRKAVQAVQAKQHKDPNDKKEEKTLEDDEAVLNSRSTRGLREATANRVYWYLVGYSGWSGFLLLLHGSKYNGFSLDTPVLSLLVGSTAVSAIGLVGIVVKGLFK